MLDSVPENLWEAFRETAERQASRQALIFANRTISFTELRSLGERAGQWLADFGLARGDVVAIELPKRPETYALWLGCLRQGLPYVFVDPKNPRERTAGILARTRAALYVSTQDHTNPSGRKVVLPAAEADESWLDTLPAGPPAVSPAVVNGHDPAYIMFTSGSTGEPKGAVIPHIGVLHLMQWARASVLPAEGATVSNLNPLHFDNSVFDLFCGLMNGASLVPVETGAISNPMAWVRRLRDQQASVVFAVPTLFLTLERLKLLTPESLPDVRVFLFGGEGFPISALKTFHEHFAGQARLINVYGPTETSCICSSIEIDAAQLKAAKDGFASIGRMHRGFDHMILDEADAPAVQGELWIGGPCVGLGYYGDAAATAHGYRQDPRQDRYRSIWYKSGDIVRRDDAGLLWFVGRADNQVKIRGHRIELEEIELAAEEFPGVFRAACVAIKGPDGLELRLAFAGEDSVSEEVMRTHCATRLPAYMRPVRITRFERLPENANGKVDRKAIRSLLAERT